MGDGRERRRAWWSRAALGLLMVTTAGTTFELTMAASASDESAPAALAASIQPSPPTTAGPPAPTTTTTVVTPPSPGGCHPAYQRTCIPPTVRDADCFGTGGDGPWIVRDEDVRIVGDDVFRLDLDFDGIACESQPGLHGAGS
jgi:hypothetical protein